MRTTALLVLALLASTLRQGSGGQAQPTFRGGTDLVEVDVRVVGKDGHFITDLKAQDFQLFEDGSPQKIQSVVLIQNRIANRGEPTEPEREPQERLERKEPQEPSVWIFLFDTNHLTPGGLKPTRDAVLQFIAEKFHDGDVAGVIADGKMANNRLTSDRAELKKAIEAIKMPGDAQTREMEIRRDWPRFQDEFEIIRIAIDNDPETLRNVVQRACNEEPDQCRVPPEPQVREKAVRLVSDIRRDTMLTLNTIQGLSNGLAKIAGPKSIVFVTEGFMIDRMEAELRLVVGMANRAAAHVYAIDARGMNKGSAGSQVIDQPIVRSTIGVTPQLETHDDGPNSLAVDTGGFVVRNENNFGRALDEVQADAGTYYVLGYLPANAAFDGKYRAISVKVNRADVKVRARAGYLALAPAKLLKAGPIARATTPAGAPAAAPVAVIPDLPETPLGAEALPGASPSAATLTQIERLKPNLAESASAARGWNAYERGDVVTATGELRSATAEPAARPWVFYALGLAEFAQQHYKESVSAWEHVRASTPEFEPVYFQLADGYMLQHDEGTAISVLREAQKRWNKDPEILNAIGVIQVRRGALDAAIGSLEQATVVAPNDALAYYNLGRAHHLRMQKSLRYDRQRETWVGGDADRRKAAEYYQKYISLGGPFVQDAKDALAQLAWK